MSGARRLVGVVAALSLGGAAACSALLGIDDRTLDPLLDAGDAAGGGDVVVSGDGSGGDAAGGDGGGVDAPADGPASDGGPCSDISSDPHNCGACGHDCLGGACSMGTCQPFALVPSDAGISPRRMAQDDTSLYWTDIDHGGIWKTDKTTGVTSSFWQPIVQPDHIVVDDAGVYWGDPTPGVFSCPKAGCGASPRLVSSSGLTPYGLAIDDARIYWTENSDQAVRSAPKDGVDAGSQVLFVSDAGSPMEVASDGQLVFFTESGDGTMRRMGVDGGGLASFPSGSTSDAFGIAIDSTSVYWGLFDPSGTLYAMAKSGSMPKTLASSQVLPGPMTSDGTNLYWADFGASPTDGTIYTCPIGACSSPTALAKNQPYPRTVLVDAKALYWNDNGTNGSDGTIMKLAR